MHRDRKPAEITVCQNPTRDYIELEYRKNGFRHNEFGPAILKYDTHLNLTAIKFLKNDYTYNKNGLVEYKKEYDVEALAFKKNNETTSFIFNCRVEVTKLNIDLKVNQKIYRNYKPNNVYHIYRNLKYSHHRLDGPALIDKSSTKTRKVWMIDGKKLPEDLFHYEKGREKEITKVDILKAMLYDKEYGEFLQEKFNEASQIY